jgi:hypothetical protein
MIQPALFDEPITLRRLESHRWEAANILRGSPVDRTNWKSYILPLLFFRIKSFLRRLMGISGSIIRACTFLEARF